MFARNTIMRIPVTLYRLSFAGIWTSPVKMYVVFLTLGKNKYDSDATTSSNDDSTALNQHS